MTAGVPAFPVSTAVLFSGGVDSAVLAVHEASRGRVHPIYVSVGLAWEPAELAIMDRLLAALPASGAIAPLVSLRFDMRDVYPPDHWAIRGEPPAHDTPDEDVYLVGRNVSLLAKAAGFCALEGVGRLVVGTLAGNPFPDATPRFFAAMSEALSLGLAAPLEVAAPFSSLAKADVVRLGTRLGVPLELTLSCMNPQAGLHCGRCSKCRERRDAFAAAGLRDPVPYATALRPGRV